MIAILGGLGAALAWAVATLCSARSSRLIGSAATLSWAMLIGLAVVTPLLLIAGPVSLSGAELGWMAASGLGTVVGLLLFVGICGWAWARRNRAQFDEAAHLPFRGDH